MKIRKLNLKDCFKLAGILSKANLKTEISALLSEARKETVKAAIKQNNSPKKDAENAKEQLKEKLGIDVFMLLIERAPQVETEIYDLLAGICGVTAEEIAEIEITELIEVMKKIAAENDLTSFFTSALN